MTGSDDKTYTVTLSGRDVEDLQKLYNSYLRLEWELLKHGGDSLSIHSVTLAQVNAIRTLIRILTKDKLDVWGDDEKV